jgi:hypothetical protein
MTNFLISFTWHHFYKHYDILVVVPDIKIAIYILNSGGVTGMSGYSRENILCSQKIRQLSNCMGRPSTASNCSYYQEIIRLTHR